MNEATRAFTTALDCKHSVENHESDDTCWQCTMKIVDITKEAEQRSEAVEAQRDELAAQLGEVRMLLNAAEDETTSDAAARIVDLLATAQARIAELEEQARDNNRRIMTGQPYIVHTRPTEWDTETPLGQMLDGLGDEVEP